MAKPVVNGTTRWSFAEMPQASLTKRELLPPQGFLNRSLSKSDPNIAASLAAERRQESHRAENKSRDDDTIGDKRKSAFFPFHHRSSSGGKKDTRTDFSKPKKMEKEGLPSLQQLRSYSAGSSDLFHGEHTKKSHLLKKLKLRKKKHKDFVDAEQASASDDGLDMVNGSGLKTARSLPSGLSLVGSGIVPVTHSTLAESESDKVVGLEDDNQSHSGARRVLAGKEEQVVGGWRLHEKAIAQNKPGVGCQRSGGGFSFRKAFLCLGSGGNLPIQFAVLLLGIMLLSFSASWLWRRPSEIKRNTLKHLRIPDSASPTELQDRLCDEHKLHQKRLAAFFSTLAESRRSLKELHRKLEAASTSIDYPKHNSAPFSFTDRPTADVAPPLKHSLNAKADL